MNYHYIKNNFKKIDNEYPDIFDIKIYYLNENNCQILVERLDSNDGWGLILEIIIYDLIDNQIFENIIFGNSDENTKSLSFETNIKLYLNDTIKTNIPKIIYPRYEYLINNKYELFNNELIDLHVVIYKLNNFKIKIIIRRLDEEYGWNNNLLLILYDKNINNIKEFINIGTSDNNYKYILKNTKIEIFSDKDYTQIIPKIIIQTGFNDDYKSILHFNSIISFIELNPEYTYIYFNNKNSRKFLKDNFCDEINYAYDLLVPGAFKADLLRYCVLYHIGGCYFDCKQILKIPIRQFLEPNKTLVLCNDVIDNALLNAVIFSVKKNIIIEKTIKDCCYNIINKLGSSALDVTGPIFFYKSIKKYINTDNLILQNNRPPDNFLDFTNDYLNNTIKTINNNKVIINRFYKNYYVNYLDNNHYGKLFDNNEVYYKNFQNLNNFKICVYPNKFNDKFLFNLINNKLIIKRTDSNNGWTLNLKILVIHNINHNEYLIEIGPSNTNKKEIIFDYI